MGLWSFAVIYFFGLMVRRYSFFFQFSVSVSFSTLSVEARAGQGRAGQAASMTMTGLSGGFRILISIRLHEASNGNELRAASCGLRAANSICFA